MFCPSCGREIREGAAYCEGCGAPVGGGSAPPGGPAGSGGAAPPPEEGAYARFVGDRAPFYLGKFRNFRLGSMETFAPTWNWSAFLFVPWWFLYRKMYLWALLAFALDIVPGIGLVARIGCGVAGNYLYYLHAAGRIREASACLEGEALDEALARLGGVNRWVIPVGVVVGGLVFLAGLFFLVAMLGLSRCIPIPAPGGTAV